MIKFLIFLTAAGFYLSLTAYIGAELYYNHTYWRLVLRKRRRVRWEVALWLLRAMIVLFGISVIALISLKV
jgi:hypothetical protein